MPKQEQRVRLPPPKATGTMRLGNITKGRLKESWRLLLAGIEGIGKTSFGAAMPKPIFIEPERGSGHLDVARFPTPRNFADVLDAVRELRESTHDYQTLVIDTVDWVEPLIWSHMCIRDRQPDIEEYGYGKGYQLAVDEWRLLLRELEQLERAKAMNVLLLGHSVVRTFKNPEGEDFDRYELMMNVKAGGLLKQWASAVLFAHYEQYAEKKKGALKAKGVASGERLIFTNRTAAYDAKNRYELPASLPLSWDEFMRAATTQRTPAELIELITINAKNAGADVEKQVVSALERAGEDTAKLTQLNNWVVAKAAIAPQPTTEES